MKKRTCINKKRSREINNREKEMKEEIKDDKINTTNK